MSARVIEVVAAVVRDPVGRMLLVRKRGTAAFMQPGGKREPDEGDVAALMREIDEELGCRVVPESVRPMGQFEAPAANEPGYKVRAAVYAVEIDGAVVPAAEIDEIRWLDPREPTDLHLAPLTRDHVMPLALGEAR
ncbi:hydrolase, nudix family [Afipia carboxidovorans OM5]|nr:NUDIX domain-containing protein [Afipia carboxidovorans]ACI94402.1 hydrolase, nudix family [Afipia carboxidovorans OM5]BEV46305.1 NUDIX domain-containing protein [Afipia carboxidovorans]